MGKKFKISFLLTFLLTLIVSIGAYTSTASAATNSQSEAISHEVLVELNNLRSQNGESKVTGVYPLANLAQNRADYLSNIGRLDEHAGYDYKQGAPYTAVAGENIGYWYNSAISDPKVIAKHIIANLYDDTGIANFGHRKNMLNPYFQHVGIGVSINPITNYIYYAQDFGTTSAELGNNYDAAVAYANYTKQDGLSSQYPTKYDQNATVSTTKSEIFPGATKINSVVSTQGLTRLYDAPTNGKLSNRGLAPNTDWYTDQVYVDSAGNHWYRVSTSEWAMINNASIRNI
ncbi:CAP domain-containing protein [Companilactobacillus zhongbaensis]|uniref:CAP domain-containing protein n=1 Tax=Companilactobacillus zhongbaensis TaxID=2486009 RepID=UPI000F7756AA|nr:CAP domain-containing protein [Companilactobacillus zhongbaensis]